MTVDWSSDFVNVMLRMNGLQHFQRLEEIFTIIYICLYEDIRCNSHHLSTTVKSHK